MGRADGLDEKKILAVASHHESAVFDPLERRVLDYAEALSRAPADPSELLVATLRDELGEAGLVELTAAIAWENFRARFNRGFDVSAQGFSEGACCALPARGEEAVDRP